MGLSSTRNTARSVVQSTEYTCDADTSIASRVASKSITRSGSRNGLMPVPMAADRAGTTSRPKTSITHSSPERAGSSSKPASHAPAIDRPVTTTRASMSMRIGGSDSHPRNVACGSRTTSPDRNGCWPSVLPAGPEQFAVWTPDTRSGGRWSSAHQIPCSGGIDSTRAESRCSHVARLASSELHAGR